jgi:Flp pilus assembly pilin Flp
MVRPVSYGKLRQYVTSGLAWAESECGQALAEYSLVLALIALVVVVALTALGLVIPGPLQEVAAKMGL